MSVPADNAGGFTPPRRRPTWLTVLLYVVLFSSGFICGAGFTGIVIQRHIRQAIQHPDQALDEFTHLLRRRLRLTPDQEVQVHEILKQRQVVLQQLRRQVQPEIERQFQLLSQEIEKVLTPEQQATWHRMVERMQRWRPPLPPANPQTGPSGSSQPAAP